MEDARKFDDRLNISELLKVGFPDVAPKRQVRTAALALDTNQTGLVQLLDVM